MLVPAFVQCSIAFVLAASSPAWSAQYRSKILVTPEGELAQGAELSIEELEKQISSIEAPYAKSSAGRHLARHYVQQKEYDKAIEFYRQALAAEGLSDVANREMLRELAQVYLLKKDYPAAAKVLDQVLAIDLVPEATDYLLLAQSYYRSKKYVEAVAALDGIRDKGLTLDRAQMHQAVAIYYRTGAFAQAGNLLRQLLEVEPHNADNWHQLVSVYLQQNKRRKALDQLSLAREKAIPFSQQDVLLLVDLHAVHKSPYVGAEILQEAITTGEVEGSAAHYRKLFELWFLARENERAQEALEKAAALSGDTELYLYLAQLLLEQRDWKALNRTMIAACRNQLEDRFVSRANVMLGISQLKLGDEEGARRSFINATLIIGANAEAGQWLDYMEAAPATPAESRRIVGICYGSKDKGLDAGELADERVASVDNEIQPGFQIKTVDSMRLFYREYQMPLEELASKARTLVVRMGVALVKSGGAADGPMQIISEGELPQEGDPTWQLALPASGSPRAGGKYRLRKAPAFKCATLSAEGEGAELVQRWLQFAEDLQDAGYVLTGERRMVVSQAGGLELQLGVE